MCPEKERYMRETRNQLSCFELIPETEMVRERWVSLPWMITVGWSMHLSFFLFCFHMT